jgi:phosphoserine phosphatase
MNDERLENLAKRLGSEAAARLDVDATARKVVERLRERPVRRLVWGQQTWLRIAAALVIVVGGAVVASRLPPGYRPGSNTHGAHFVADDLNDLSADELRDVLASFDQLISSDSLAVPEGSTDLHELDAQQLRAVLRSLEG